MLQALLALRPANEDEDEDDAGWFTVDVTDVDADPGLVAQYDELVPVLVGSRDDGEAIQLCHYFLDAGAVKQFLSE